MQFVKTKENPIHRKILRKAAVEMRLKHIPVLHIEVCYVIVVEYK
jgi:hypothetical protein